MTEPNPPAPDDEPFYLDRAAFKRNTAHAAATFAQGDALHREIASRMLERLGYICLLYTSDAADE